MNKYYVIIYCLYILVPDTNGQKVWSAQDIPYPLDRNGALRCQLGRVGRVCDPDTVLSSADRTTLSDQLGKIHADTFNINGVNKCDKKGVNIMVAIVSKVKVETGNADTDIKRVADALRDTYWKRDSDCGKTVLILLSVGDQKLHTSFFTVTGLTDSFAKRAFSDNTESFKTSAYYNGLSNMASFYKTVYINNHQSQGQPGQGTRTTHTNRNNNISKKEESSGGGGFPWYGWLIIAICVAVLLCCCCVCCIFKSIKSIFCPCCDDDDDDSHQQGPTTVNNYNSGGGGYYNGYSGHHPYNNTGGAVGYTDPRNGSEPYVSGPAIGSGDPQPYIGEAGGGGGGWGDGDDSKPGPEIEADSGGGGGGWGAGGSAEGAGSGGAADSSGGGGGATESAGGGGGWGGGDSGGGGGGGGDSGGGGGGDSGGGGGGDSGGGGGGGD